LFSRLFFFAIAGKLVIQIQVLFDGVLVQFRLEKVDNELALTFGNTTILFRYYRKKLCERLEYFFTRITIVGMKASKNVGR
jgi:hypothetical protein